MHARRGLTVQVSMVYGRGEVIEPFKTRRRQWNRNERRRGVPRDYLFGTAPTICFS